MEDYTKFRAKTIKLRTRKQFKVTNSYGTKAAWRWLKKNKWPSIGTPISEHDFGYIIKTINKRLVELFVEGHDIKFPCGMGSIELRKCKTSVKFDNGKLKTNLPVDWKKTLELWYEDKSAREDKILVRQEQDYTFRIRYKLGKANYPYKSYFTFIPNRTTKKKLAEGIRNNDVDAFLIT